MNNIKATNEGREACLQGKDRSANPYEILSEDWVDWDCGYTFGTLEKPKKCEVA